MPGIDGPGIHSRIAFQATVTLLFGIWLLLLFAAVAIAALFADVLANYGSVVPFIGATIITAGTLLLTTFTLNESLPLKTGQMR